MNYSHAAVKVFVALHLKLLLTTQRAAADPRMTSGKVVELFYDVVSPYSWLGFEVCAVLMSTTASDRFV